MFGFDVVSPRGPYEGQGDGNGVLEGQGQPADGSYPAGDIETSGETVAFWVDLSTANLIDGQFTLGQDNAIAPNPLPPNPVTGSAIGQLYPAAKIGRGNYIYVYSDGQVPGPWVPWYHRNYFGISVINGVGING
jgi:hypothetical protein